MSSLGVCAVLVAAGCYGTTTVPVDVIASVEHPLTAPVELPGNVRLGPRTEVRARFSDGSVTAWWPAGRLLVAEDGLVLPASRPRKLYVGDLDDGAADGVLWRDVWGLELHNLDAARTAGAVIGAPVAMSLMLVAALGASAAIANDEDPTPSLFLGAEVAGAVDAAAESADSEAQPGSSPERMPDERVAALLLNRGPANGRRAPVPLFSDRARRRDDLKLVLAAEGGITATGTFTGGLGLGLRLCDFVELTARVRALPFAEDALTYATDSPSLASVSVPSSSPWPGFLFGGRVALHIDGDGDPHTAFLLGGEMLGGRLASGAALTELGLVLGPRFGLGQSAFVSLLLTPSLLLFENGPGAVDSVGGDRAAGATAAQFMITAELGFGI